VTHVQTRDMRHGHPFQFAWRAADDHQWIEANIEANALDSAHKPRAYLVPVAGMLKGYKPLESATGLFRDFSQLERTEDAFRGFANKYGMLGAGSSLVIPTSSPQFAVASTGITRQGKKKGEPLVLGESFDFWAEQVSAMNRAVQLWAALSSATPQDKLRNFIEWRDEGSVIYRHSGEAWELIATKFHHPELLPRLQYPDLLQPAWYQLQNLVNQQLEKLASCPQLLWERTKLLLFIRPQSLIAAMWLQFALAIDGERQYRRCEGCGRWFEIGGGRMRTDSQTCGQTCRQRKHRERQKKAAHKTRRGNIHGSRKTR